MNNIDIKIMSRMDAMEYTYIAKEPTIIISISEHGTPNILIDETNTNVKDILNLKFSNVLHTISKYNAMTKEQALEVKNFINKYKNKEIKTIVVHCCDGHSRSAAVASAILKYLKGNDEQILHNKQYLLNKHCYNLCLEAFGLNNIAS